MIPIVWISICVIQVLHSDGVYNGGKSRSCLRPQTQISPLYSDSLLIIYIQRHDTVPCRRAKILM